MSKVTKLTVEKWCDHITASLEALGYDSIESAYEDNFEKAIQLYLQFGISKHDAMGFGSESLMCYEFVNSGKQVYNFDPDFTQSILNENWANNLYEILEYVPHRSFYLKLPHNETSEGTVVAILDESEVNWVVEGSVYHEKYADRVTLYGTSINLSKWTFAEVECETGKKYICRWAIPRKFENMFDDTELGDYPIELALNAIAYLCSVNADINQFYIPPKLNKPNNKKDKRRSFATWYNVGYSIGNSLREYERYVRNNEDSTISVRPHMRRAHWHHYWVGHKGSQRLELRWILPTKVGFDDIEHATLHRVV